MIRYAASGSRAYGDQPMPPHTRYSWEIQAVVEGRCALWLERERVWRERTLWLFPPDCLHGWIAERGTTCRICVVHVPTVPDLLRLAVAERGHLEVSLDDEGIRRVEQLVASATAIAASDPLAGLRCDALLADLGLFIAEHLPAKVQRRFTPPAPPARLVDDAIAWMAGNLARQPGVAAVAAAVGCSTPHLRRMFLRVRGEPPHAVLAALRLQRAEELMRDRDLTLAEVARLSGFLNGMSLSRSFRSARGQPPSRASGRR